MTAAPTVWTLGNGDTVNWPADTQAGNGNPGVAQIVSQTNGAIGYVDLADATAAKLDTRQDQELVRQASSHRHSTVPRPRSAGATVNAGPDVQPAQRVRRQGVPDHVADVHHRLQDDEELGADRRTSRGGSTTSSARPRTWPRMPGSHRCPAASRTRQSPRSTRSSKELPRMANPSAPEKNRAAGSVTQGNAGDVWADRIFRGLALVAGLAVLAILALIAYLDHHVRRGPRSRPRASRSSPPTIGPERGQVRRAGLHLRHAATPH